MVWIAFHYVLWWLWLNRNVRNEIKKGKKIYFYDNGIRNAVLGNFLPLSSRMDTGALWENFLISERHKFLVNKDIEAQRYFWRITQQQEINYIEELDSRLFAFEFKWNPARKPFLSKTFANAYPLSEFQVISPENLHLFLTETLQKKEQWYSEKVEQWNGDWVTR